MTRTRGVLGPETLSQYRWIDLPYGTVIRPNAAHGIQFRVRLTGNATLEPPINGVQGQRIDLRVAQDSTGGRTVTLHSGWSVIGSVAVQPAANSVTILSAMCVEPGTWDIWQSSPSAGSAYPVGSVFLGSGSTDPSILLGFGTWSPLGNGSITVGAGSFTAYVWERLT